MLMFADRHDAGRVLACKLADYEDREKVVVLGLPRGGVVVAFEVARALRVPLDVFVVRKLGVPGQEELAFGAIAGGGVKVLNRDVLQASKLSEHEMDAIAAKETVELERRERLYRGGRPPLHLGGKTIILVDDGLATGASMRTAIRALRAQNPGWITMAVPTAPARTCKDLEREVDEAVCVMTPDPFLGVGQWYLDFSQTTDEEVITLLKIASGFRRASRSAGEPPASKSTALDAATPAPAAAPAPVPTSAPVAAPAPATAAPALAREVSTSVDGHTLKGDLHLVPGSKGLVMFVHGSGSSRFSPRNQAMAGDLQATGLSTLFFDLLSDDEAHFDDTAGEVHFDISLLTDRVVAVTEWVLRQPDTRAMAIGYFGASTGAAAALKAAARFSYRPTAVQAVVSRGGRPDLAMDDLPNVVTPTLLLVGGRDSSILGLNELALAELAGPSELHVVRGATHLFEEPGTMEEVSRLACAWFARYLDPAE
jgi:putative phosphoribosyl transferase